MDRISLGSWLARILDIVPFPLTVTVGRAEEAAEDVALASTLTGDGAGLAETNEAARARVPAAIEDFIMNFF